VAVDLLGRIRREGGRDEPDDCFSARGSNGPGAAPGDPRRPAIRPRLDHRSDGGGHRPSRACVRVRAGRWAPRDASYSSRAGLAVVRGGAAPPPVPSLRDADGCYPGGIGSRTRGYDELVTIPDIGHCVGSGTPPVDGTGQQNDEGIETGICPACSGRFPLHHTRVLALHDAAETGEREAWTNPAG
jgi:hypothetical protein